MCIGVNKVINVILLILGIVMMVYSTGISFIVDGLGRNLFILGLFLIVFALVKIFFCKLQHRKVIKIFNNILNILICCFLIFFIVIEGIIISYGNKKEVTNTKYVLILGAGLWGDTPSNTLVKRLDSAINIINKDTKVIVSGGKGEGETVTEAEAMEMYLISKGINKNQIIREDESRNTYENIKNSNQILRGIEKDKDFQITIVTSNFHMFRANMLASRFKIKNSSYSASVMKSIEPGYYIREFFAVLKSYIFDR